MDLNNYLDEDISIINTYLLRELFPNNYLINLLSICN